MPYHSLPGYNAPYLSVYSENAIDVFDVNSMEWIQTIPLKKVTSHFSVGQGVCPEPILLIKTACGNIIELKEELLQRN